MDWPQQPPTEKVLKFRMMIYDSTQKFCFAKHQNSTVFNSLDDSEFLSSNFPGLRTSSASMTSTASTTSVASTTFTASFHQKILLILIVGLFLAPKWPILVLFCGMDLQKSNFSLISDALFVRGCWSQLMLLFWKLVDETQMSKPLEPTRPWFKKTIDPSTPQSHLVLSISIWYTLYLEIFWTQIKTVCLLFLEAANISRNCFYNWK